LQKALLKSADGRANILQKCHADQEEETIAKKGGVSKITKKPLNIPKSVLFKTKQLRRRMASVPFQNEGATSRSNFETSVKRKGNQGAKCGELGGARGNNGGTNLRCSREIPARATRGKV